MRLAIVSLPCLLLVACGYTMSSRSDGFSGKPERLFIGVVESRLSPPRPEAPYELTRWLKQEATLDRRFELGSQSGNDVAVQIAMTKFSEPTAVKNFENDPTEVALGAQARVRIVSSKTSREVEVGATGSYAPGLGESREEGVERLMRDLARNVLDAIAERDWMGEQTTQP